MILQAPQLSSYQEWMINADVQIMWKKNKIKAIYAQQTTIHNDQIKNQIMGHKFAPSAFSSHTVSKLLDIVLCFWESVPLKSVGRLSEDFCNKQLLEYIHIYHKHKEEFLGVDWSLVRKSERASLPFLV